MSARLELTEFKAIAPAAAEALAAMSKAAAAGLDKGLIELVKVRASQINGCAFCLQFHLDLARQLGIAPAKLDLLVVWREISLFSQRERAALAWTEALTAISGEGVSDSLYAEATALFSQDELASLTTAIAVINAWNRIGVAYRCSPPVAHSAKAAAA
jgi:AhpD family alkylhydroperoxidase